MDHMNIFNNYSSRNLKNEDVLTRGFLLLLRLIPLYRIRFFELLNSKLEYIDGYKKLVFDDVEEAEVRTQVDSSDNWLKSFDGLLVVSVLISNQEYTTKDQIKNHDNIHRYDGVIKTPNTLFIIENKPNINNVWREQLNLNIDKSREIAEDLCSIKWSDIIYFSNIFLKGNIISNTERDLIEDFIEYIDYCYPELNPYDNFSLCKNEEILFKKRCCEILENLIDNAKVSYHRGWNYKINSGNYEIPEIALQVDINNSKDFISLNMYAGESMECAKSMLKKINVDKLQKLLKDERCDVYPNFHIAAYAKNRFWSRGDISLIDYIRFWINELNNNELRQVSRKIDKEAFASYYEKLVDSKVVNKNDYGEFKEIFIDSNYPVMNICPAISFQYWWDRNRAVELDSEGKFISEVKNKMNTIFDVFSNE